LDNIANLSLSFNLKGIEEVNEQEENLIKKVFVSPTHLPFNFAEDVLDLEMKLENGNNVTQKDIDRLVYLYSQGMEYYEEIDKKRYQSFKDRVQKVQWKYLQLSRSFLIYQNSDTINCSKK
jgi:hypothetical protein